MGKYEALSSVNRRAVSQAQAPKTTLRALSWLKWTNHIKFSIGPRKKCTNARPETKLKYRAKKNLLAPWLFDFLWYARTKGAWCFLPVRVWVDRSAVCKIERMSDHAAGVPLSFFAAFSTAQCCAKSAARHQKQLSTSATAFLDVSPTNSLF